MKGAGAYMQLSVTRQTYNGREAAELAGLKKPYFLTFIRNQLKLKHINDTFVREYAEDVFHDGIAILLTSHYDCANADEAIVEAMTRAVQDVVREFSKRKEVSETLTYSDSKDGDRELSRFDLNCSSESAEELVLNQEDCCTLDEAIERMEAIRYNYGFDLTLSVLLHAGVVKQMWDASTVNGLLSAFESAHAMKKYLGDLCIARVVSAAAEAEPSELIATMQRNLSRCDLMLSALGYCGV